MKHWLLFYGTVEDYVTRRAPLRKAHIEYAQAARARNELVLAGALADPPDGAVLIFQSETSAIAEQFAKSDPYVINGLITRWRVREWTTVVGEPALTPIDPTKL
jgi:uncharacterized protein